MVSGHGGGGKDWKELKLRPVSITPYNYTVMSTRISLQWGEHEDVEDINRYAAGGYHPVRLVDMFKSNIATYRVLHKLGRGSSATVWLAQTLPVSGEADTSSP